MLLIWLKAKSCSHSENFANNCVACSTVCYVPLHLAPRFETQFEMSWRTSILEMPKIWNVCTAGRERRGEGEGEMRTRRAARRKRERESRHGKRGRVLAAYNFDDKQRGGYLPLLLTLSPRTASGEPPPRDCINSSRPSTPASHLHLTLPSVLPLPRVSFSPSSPPFRCRRRPSWSTTSGDKRSVSASRIMKRARSFPQHSAVFLLPVFASRAKMPLSTPKSKSRSQQSRFVNHR